MAKRKSKGRRKSGRRKSKKKGRPRKSKKKVKSRKSKKKVKSRKSKKKVKFRKSKKKVKSRKSGGRKSKKKGRPRKSKSKKGRKSKKKGIPRKSKNIPKEDYTPDYSKKGFSITNIDSNKILVKGKKAEKMKKAIEAFGGKWKETGWVVARKYKPNIHQILDENMTFMEMAKEGPMFKGQNGRRTIIHI